MPALWRDGVRAIILHPITVDTRERDATQIVRELERQGVPARVAALPDNGGGDFRWLVEPEADGQPWLAVTVERKSVSDLLNSANDGRLAAFTATASSEVAMRFLLLHGDPERDRQHGRNDQSPEAIDNLLVSIQTDGVVVIRAGAGVVPLTSRLASLWRWTGKDDHGSYRRPALPLTESVYFNARERDAVRNLMTLPGWGERRARDIHRALGLRKVYEALLAGDDKDLRTVRGVGAGTISSAIEFLSE